MERTEQGEEEVEGGQIMSLRVWLPLDGDLHNQGLTLLPDTSVNTFTYASGKIGQCATGRAAWHLNEEILGNTWSVAMWVKPGSLGTNNNILFCKNNTSSTDCHIYFSIISTTQLNLGVNGPSSSVTATGQTFTTGTWYHVAATYDGTIATIYLNGRELKHGTVTTACPTGRLNMNINGRSTNAANTNTTGNITCSFNDFRLYDHCLSAAEVREISQGLVLHYPLNKNSLKPIGTNLVTGVTKGGQTTLLTDGRIGVITSGTSADTYFTVNLSESITNGTTYYLSCDVSGVSDGQYWGFPLGAQSNTSMPSKFYNGHNEYIFTANNINWGANRLFMDDNYRQDYAHPASFYNFVLIKNPTFEEVDGSGLGHNSTSNAPITTSEDTSRYEEASYFGAYNTPVLTVNNFSALAPALTSCTITWWGKYDTTKTLLFTGHTTSYYLAASNNNTYYHGNGGTITFYKDGIAGTYKCAADGWHHFAMTGVNLSSWTALKLNGYSGSWPLKGYISDLRIYNTILSADDILQLYHTGAKVDNKQNLHTFELNETNINLLSGTPWCAPFYLHAPFTSPFTNYNSNGEPQFTSNSASAGTGYIEISPTGHTYEYDYTISVNAGNQFYIGFERYDANKTARSNNACVYTFASKPSSNIVKQHYTGTINLATDGTNPCKYIALRILNGWSGTTSGVTGTATIHSISLRQIGTKQQPKITKTGLCIGEELKEETNTKLHKNGIIETNNLIEL